MAMGLGLAESSGEFRCDRRYASAESLRLEYEQEGKNYLPPFNSLKAGLDVVMSSR